MRWLLVLLALAACEEEKKDGAGAPAKSDAAGVVVDAWKEGGLTVTAFTAADGEAYGGGDCRAGQVNGVDAVLCLYATEELARGAEPKGLEQVGAATGTALTKGEVLLVMVDRKKADPEGRTINTATKIFIGKKSE
jgi:hypothetical protein